MTPTIGKIIFAMMTAVGAFVAPGSAHFGDPGAVAVSDLASTIAGETNSTTVTVTLPAKIFTTTATIFTTDHVAKNHGYDFGITTTNSCECVQTTCSTTFHSNTIDSTTIEIIEPTWSTLTVDIPSTPKTAVSLTTPTSFHVTFSTRHSHSTTTCSETTTAQTTTLPAVTPTEVVTSASPGSIWAGEKSLLVTSLAGLFGLLLANLM